MVFRYTKLIAYDFGLVAVLYKYRENLMCVCSQILKLFEEVAVYRSYSFFNNYLKWCSQVKQIIEMANKRNLLLLFERKLEPVFMEKGPNNAVFDVPNNLLSDRYKSKPSITDRFGEAGGERIPVKSNISIPNITKIMALKRDENFSLFIPRHRDLAAQLVHIFIGINQYHF